MRDQVTVMPNAYRFGMALMRSRAVLPGKPARRGARSKNPFMQCQHLGFITCLNVAHA